MEFLITSGIADHAIQLFAGIIALVVGLRPGLLVQKEEQLTKFSKYKKFLVIAGGLLIAISLFQIGVRIHQASQVQGVPLPEAAPEPGADAP